MSQYEIYFPKLAQRLFGTVNKKWCSSISVVVVYLYIICTLYRRRQQSQPNLTNDLSLCFDTGYNVSMQEVEQNTIFENIVYD